MRLTAPLAVLLVIGVAPPGAGQPDREVRLSELRKEIGRLERELEALRRQEGGVLLELERLSAELNLGRTQLRELDLRSESIRERIDGHEQALGELDQWQQERRRYLSFRLREMYKGGSRQALYRLLGDRGKADSWAGMRYAAFLSGRDREVLEGYRRDRRRVDAERQSLFGEQHALAGTRDEIRLANRRLAAGRRRQQRVLDSVRDDAARREAALVELREAADGLAGLIGGLESPPAPPALDMNRFRGLLDWPAVGDVRAGFGSVTHPRFKTKVPHPGIDIRARSGDPIRSVFDGEVVFSGWMRGYGLTTIVDHGNGLHSVYAHAAVTWLEPGERVRRGQRLGIVGETGSFSGPSLYFELRLNGRAVDPQDWLRPR